MNSPVIQMKFEPQEFEHTCSSGRTFKMRELSGFEQMTADSCSEGLQGIFYFRAARSLVSVDGENLMLATTGPQLIARLEGLRGKEVDELVAAYIQHFQPVGDNLKNESTPAPAA